MDQRCHTVSFLIIYMFVSASGTNIVTVPPISGQLATMHLLDDIILQTLCYSSYKVYRKKLKKQKKKLSSWRESLMT